MVYGLLLKVCQDKINEDLRFMIYVVRSLRDFLLPTFNSSIYYALASAWFVGLWIDGLQSWALSGFFL